MEGNDHRTGIGRRQRKQLETRERLYQCAMQLLSEHDFHEVTVERITEAADVGKGTFFNYFSNKEAIVRYRFELEFELLSALLGRDATLLDGPAHAIGDTQEACRRAVDNGEHQEAGNVAEATEELGPLEACAHALNLLERERRLGRGGPVWRRIVTTMHFVGEEDGRSKQLLRNLLALGLVNDEVRRACLDVHASLQEIAEQLIIAGQQNGELRDDIPAREMSDYLRGVYLNIAYQWAESDGEEDIHTVIDRHLPFLWSALRKADYQESITEPTNK